MKIGIVKLEYSVNGLVTAATFEPTMKIEYDGKLLNDLAAIESAGEKKLCEQANVVFASWFAKMNEIELADRSEYHIVNKLINCTTLHGAVKSCEIEFSFELIQHN
jgi:hypothetical protein